MKKIFISLLLTASFAFAMAQTISFDKTIINYGQIQSGDDGVRLFTVTNVGDKPLIISKVEAACGCTTPQITKEPIMPGKSAILRVGYNTGLVGAFSKDIKVYSNDPKNERSVVTIQGNVERFRTHEGYVERKDRYN